MGVITWLVLGIVVGLVARSVVPGDDPGGTLAAVLVGAVGALIGGWIGNLLAGSGYTAASVWSIILAIAGASVLLGVYRTALRHAP